MQQGEAILIRRSSDAFQQRMEAFRAFFQKTAPFAIQEESLQAKHVRSPLHAFCAPCLLPFLLSFPLQDVRMYGSMKEQIQA